VVAKDVAQAIRTGAAPKAAAPAPAPGPAAQAVPAAGPVAVAGEGDEVVKMSKMRKVVADRMSASAREIPSVSQNVRADVTKLLALRAQVNEGRENRISLNDFVLKATAKALLRHPEINSALDGNGNIIRYRHAHIGVAVSVPGGLMVPVLRNAEAKGLEALAEEARGLAARARTGSLEGAELQGSTFSVSNLGMYGVTSFTPIINQPNAAILGVCAVEDQPALDGEGRLYNRKVMTLCLTYDHRLIDGAEAAAFEQTLKALLEEPLNILL
ncbi:MAG TPA: dihydrolipoamide acetyltransferase family protein, partial [Candidatus Limnocylindria bacterium]|nr:dihydrolipoamide acetyltransferase family protein [Candidatus Limnocylindria bacterium]